MIELGRGLIGWSNFSKLFDVLKSGGFVRINDKYGLKMEKSARGIVPIIYLLGKDEKPSQVLVNMVDRVPKKAKPKKQKKEEMFTPEETEEEDLFA